MLPTDSIRLRLSFENSKAQLELRMKQWKILKKNRSSDMSFIAARAKQRADLGKETVFRVGGLEVSRQSIQRFTRRMVSQELEAISPRAGMFKDVRGTQSQ